MRRFLGLGLAIFSFLLPASSQARDFNCDASALRASIAGQVVEPVTANRGNSQCLSQASPASASNSSFSAGVLVAETRAEEGKVQAKGGLAEFSVSLAELNKLKSLTLPAQEALSKLQPVKVPIPLSGQLLGLPAEVTVDAAPAVSSLVSGALSGELVSLNQSVAYARANCDNGELKLSGSSLVSGLKVLGQELPTDQLVNQTFTAVPGSSIDFSSLDLSKLSLPAGLSFTDPVVGQILQDAVVARFTTLPNLEIPAALLEVKVVPAEQQVKDGGLTQHGLKVFMSLGGQFVLGAVIGEARVSVDSLACSAPEQERGAVLAKEALKCDRRKVTLIDVLDKGRYVYIAGAADRRFIGKKVTLSLRGKKVGKAKVLKSGLFKAKLPVPKGKLRYSDQARYQASYKHHRSLNLKLHRRLLITSTKVRGGKVTIKGKVVLPMTSPRSEVVMRRRLSCSKSRVVAKVRPDRDGRFSVILKAPKRGKVGVYRATTYVELNPRDRVVFKTYTLPRIVTR